MRLKVTKSSTHICTSSNSYCSSFCSCFVFFCGSCFAFIFGCTAAWGTGSTSGMKLGSWGVFVVPQSVLFYNRAKFCESRPVGVTKFLFLVSPGENSILNIIPEDQGRPFSYKYSLCKKIYKTTSIS